MSDVLALMIGLQILDAQALEYYVPNNDLTSVPVDIPPETTSVDLSHNRITNLTSGVFRNLSRCTNLELSYNRISHLEFGSFSGLIITDIS